MALLIIIYIAFVSLGLPDALLGSSWTVMHVELNTSVEFAGLISMIICGGTIVSSLSSSRLIHKFSTVKVVVTSVVLTSIALIGFSLSQSLAVILLCSVPLGLGAGSIDAALNNFVALHYKPRHMNWLHCFWGVGASGGPLILALVLSRNGTWRTGYLSIGVIQMTLAFILVLSLPLWKRFMKDQSVETATHVVSNKVAIKIKGVKYNLITFFLYCSLEGSAGLWAASYLTIEKGISPVKAALWTSMYFAGITIGRFVSGILADYVAGRNLIRGGLSIIFIGVIILVLPLNSYMSLAGLIFIGLGCAPIYPSMIHLTPGRFGKKSSQAVIGLSMAFAYIGSTFIPPFLGALSSKLTFKLLPYGLLICVIGMLVTTELLRGHVPDHDYVNKIKDA